MADTIHSEAVPLNLWLLPAAEPAELAQRLAARVVDTFCPPGGFVVELADTPDEVVAAAVDVGRTAFVAPVHRPCHWPRETAAFPGADLAVALVAPAFCCRDRHRGVSLENVCARAAELVRPGGYLCLGGPLLDRTDLNIAVATATRCGFAFFQHLVGIIERAGATPTPTDVLVFRRSAT